MFNETYKNQLMNSISFKTYTADFYILKTFLNAFAFVFSLFFAIAFVLILFEELDMLLRFNASFSVGLTYICLRIPHELVKATPMVVVLAMVSAMGNLIRHNEMLMLYIAGYTPVRLAAPLALFMVLLLSLVFIFNEKICGPFAAQAETLMNIRIKGATQGFSRSGGIWMHGEENRIFHAQSFYPHINRLDDLTVIVQDDNQLLTKRIDAESALWDKDQKKWALKNAMVYVFPSNNSPMYSEKHDLLLYSLGRTPQDFSSATQNIEQMSHGDLSRMVNSVRQTGENPWMYLPDLRIKEAFPFAVFFLGLLAYSMMLYMGSAGKASGIGMGLLAVILYFMSLSLGKGFAKAEAIPPWLGAWAPNMICFVLTIYFFNKLRTEI